MRYDFLFMICIVELFVELCDLGSSFGICWNDGFLWKLYFLLTFVSEVL